MFSTCSTFLQLVFNLFFSSTFPNFFQLFPTCQNSFLKCSLLFYFFLELCVQQLYSCLSERSDHESKRQYPGAVLPLAMFETWKSPLYWSTSNIKLLHHSTQSTRGRNQGSRSLCEKCKTGIHFHDFFGEKFKPEDHQIVALHISLHHANIIHKISG